MKARPKPFEPDARPVDDAGFLAAIGATVREAREQRGMARKMLSRVADVSERYLAQLEAGEGNASITLLRRVAEALGIGLKDLLDASERRPVRRNRIALIGLRGAGKSTLGGQLAKTLRRPFVELDREIERDAGMSLSEVFLLYGEAGYRRIERRCLERLIESQQELVLTVGGGIVSEAETYNRLLANCFTVWIKASPEEHMARVVAQGDLRPMRGQPEAMKDLRRILASRQPLYGKADVAIDTSRQSVPQSLAALKKCVSPTTAERNR
ncbi:MAG TPA: helix-turn-helix transcriptional regulator [Steroidobacteraceae bacterium]|nr:helix-turn-helix transcriptional regulator [Steroidobacteraceae bacterium]